jgi:hypothetical protein
MQYLVLIYIDPALADAMPGAEQDAMMRGCLAKADALTARGTLLGYQQLEAPAAAKSIRVRDGRTAITDGPFAETKELLAGFNLIEAASQEEALAIAQEFPWARLGCIEVRPVRDVAAVRRRVALG